MSGIRSELKKIWILDYGYYLLRYVIWNGKIIGDKRMTEIKFKKKFGYSIDLSNPKTINEKIQWLKLNDRRDFNTMCADKWKVREYIKENFGDQYLIPVLYRTDNWRDITEDKLPDYPCVVKANTGTSTVRLIHNKGEVDYKELRRECRQWMYINHYYHSQEWQYKNIKPCIMVEKMLIKRDGSIPNDYKLHYINGELQFIYCVIDREGKNYRALFNKNWELLSFQWVSDSNYKKIEDPVTEPRPKSLETMIKVGEQIAKNFNYVRCDFYDVDGQMYFGEITLYHGSGFNKFYPKEYDAIYGEKLQIRSLEK